MFPQRGERVANALVGPEIDKGWIIERMIGAGREELEESYLSDIALTSKAGRALSRSEGQRPDAGRRFTAASAFRGAPARCSASTASWAAARSNSRAHCLAS